MSEVKIKKRRGRPRSETARRAILQAASALLNEGGLSAVTMEAVAARARVGKPTIYRSWPNAQALAMAALTVSDTVPTDVAETGSPLDDLKRQLHNVVVKFASASGHQVRLVLAAAESDSELAKAFRNQVILKSREEGKAILLRAVSSGVVRPDIDLEVTLDMIYGPLFYRILIGHQPLTTDFTDALLADLIRGLETGR